MNPGLLALFLSAGLAAVPMTPSPTPAADTPVDAEYKDALRLLTFGRSREAREGFERADKLAQGRCFRCLEGLAAADVRLSDFAAAVDAARRAAKVASSPDESARAQNQLGLALAGSAGSRPNALPEAEAAYREAIRLSGGKLNAIRYNLATVLLREGKRKEGLAELGDFLEREPPQSVHAALGRTLKRSPHRAGEILAPDFSAATLSGQTLSLGALSGKVVLIDFWATWCGPCRMALPELKRLQRELEKEPFQIVSISADTSLPALKDFVAKNEMTWPQFWDEKGTFASAFTVPSFPSYYLVDPDGVVIYSRSGWSPAVGKEIAARARLAIDRAQTAARSGTPPARASS